MEFNSLTIVSSELVALFIEAILFLSNILGKHRKDMKVRLYLTSIFFMFLATLLNFNWNLSGTNTHSEFWGKFMMTFTYIFSYVGTAFIGYYLIAVIDSRKLASKFFSVLILLVSGFGILYVLWGAFSNQVFYYENYHVYNGPMFRYALYLIILLGWVDVIIIWTHVKTLGIRDSFITTAYFGLPVIAVAVKVSYDYIDFIFSAVAISELIVNNMLLTRENSEATTDAEVARAAAKNKSDFLANMSHEIRTPINAVLGLNEMILRESKEQNIIEYANDISSSGNQLLNLVNDILDFSKIEAGKVELIAVSYNVASLINDIVNMISVKTEEKGLEFKIEVDENIPSGLYGDEVRLKQIIVNILSNAVKYTKEGYVKFTVGMEKVADNIMLNVSVEDTGIGMRQEDIGKLFAAFERIDETNNRNIQGTGLGMAITKRYLELMDSELDVKSVYGSGSTFSFSVFQKVIDKAPIGDVQKAFKELKSKSKEYKAMVYAPEARILVVDDLKMNLRVVTGLLKETKIQIDTALSGPEALKLLKENKYDMLFLDHMMPQMSGLEAIKLLRQDVSSKNRDIFAVALTANAVSGAKEMYIKEGFNDYLSKPIDTEKLEEMLLRHLPSKLIKERPDNVDQEISVKNDSSIDQGKNIKNDSSIGPEENVAFPENATTFEKLQMLKVLDAKKALEQYMDEEIYLIAVEGYVEELENVISLIEKEFNDKNTYEYTVQVHGLKTMARGAGAYVLGDKAYELELAGKEDNWDLINAKTTDVINEAREVGKQISSALKED